MDRSFRWRPAWRWRGWCKGRTEAGLENLNNFKYIFVIFCEKPCIYTVAHPRRSLQQGQTNEPPYWALAGDLEHRKDESQSDGGLKRKSKFSCAKKLIFLLESTCPAMTTACVTTCAISTSDGKTPAIQERSSSPSLRSVMNISPGGENSN